MKNKQAEQEIDRQRHKDQIKTKRNSEPNLDRKTPTIEEKPSILIVCEGKNTEPSYFNQFRLSSAEIKAVGEGYNTVSLVNRAIDLSTKKEYDQVWCVFDKDDFEIDNFNNAISIAEANKMGVAYSNQAFEYWIILHFNDHQGGGMHRFDYDAIINSLLKPFKVRYDGNDSKIITEEIFELLDGIDQQTGKERKLLAIERAEKMYNRLSHQNPAKEESSTTVFRLVRELLKYI